MGFILFGGKIYDNRFPGGMAYAGITTALSNANVQHDSYLMSQTRVLLHIPGREPKDGLLGWPAEVRGEKT